MMSAVRRYHRDRDAAPTTRRRGTPSLRLPRRPARGRFEPGGLRGQTTSSPATSMMVRACPSSRGTWQSDVRCGRYPTAPAAKRQRSITVTASAQTSSKRGLATVNTTEPARWAVGRALATTGASCDQVADGSALELGDAGPAPRPRPSNRWLTPSAEGDGALVSPMIAQLAPPWPQARALPRRHWHRELVEETLNTMEAAKCNAAAERCQSDQRPSHRPRRPEVRGAVRRRRRATRRSHRRRCHQRGTRRPRRPPTTMRPTTLLGTDRRCRSPRGRAAGRDRAPTPRRAPPN